MRKLRPPRSKTRSITVLSFCPMPLQNAAHWTGELESGLAEHLDTMDMIRARESYRRWLGSERTSNPDRRIWEEILNRNPNVGIVKGEETLWGKDAAEFLTRNSDFITIGKTGIFFRPQNPTQTNPPTDCERFVRLVAGIAGRHNSADDFMDEMARTFTAANDSTIREMERTANTAVPQGRQIFGPANGPNAGFKAKFRDGSNQVRHFVGGLVAGYRIGHQPALLLMNSREEPNTSGVNDADIALNGVSTALGANHVVPPRQPPLNPFRLPVNRGFHNLADEIRTEICDP